MNLNLRIRKLKESKFLDRNLKNNKLLRNNLPLNMMLLLIKNISKEIKMSLTISNSKNNSNKKPLKIQAKVYFRY